MKIKPYSWEYGCLAFYAWGGILITMDNIALFICGLIVTLVSGLGVLVYCVSLGYKKETISKEEILLKEAVILKNKPRAATQPVS